MPLVVLFLKNVDCMSRRPHFYYFIDLKFQETFWKPKLEATLYDCLAIWSSSGLQPMVGGGGFLDFSKNHQVWILLQNLQGIINFHERPAGSVLVLFQFFKFKNVCWFRFEGLYHKFKIFRVGARVECVTIWHLLDVCIHNQSKNWPRIKNHWTFQQTLAVINAILRIHNHHSKKNQRVNLGL